MLRIVIDTNVLVGSAYNAHSASRRIVDACLAGEMIMVTSPAVRREYEHILSRAVRNEEQSKRLAAVLEGAETAMPVHTPRVVTADRQDDKFLAAALAGRAEVLVTNDVHLLECDGYEGLRIVRPSELR